MGAFAVIGGSAPEPLVDAAAVDECPVAFGLESGTVWNGCSRTEIEAVAP